MQGILSLQAQMPAMITVSNTSTNIDIVIAPAVILAAWRSAALSPPARQVLVFARMKINIFFKVRIWRKYAFEEIIAILQINRTF